MVEVVGADPGELVTGALVDPLREHAVLLRPQRLAHPAVGDVADQHVLEAECAIAGDGRPFLRDDEFVVEQAVEQRVDFEVGHEPVQRAPPEDPADQRCALENALLARLQPVDAGRDHRLDAVRDAVEPFVVPEHPHDLLEEERVALGPVEQERALCRRHLGPLEQGVREQLALGGVERRELDRARAPNAAAPGRTRVEEVGPRDGDDQHRDVAERAREVLDHVEERLLGPVDVLEDEDERLQVGELLGPAQRGPRQLCRTTARLRRRRGTPSATAEQVGDSLALAAEAQLLEGVVRRVVVGDPGARLDHRGERPVRDALAVRQRAPGERRHALERVDELGDEARLAEPRLAEDGHELRAAIPHRSLERVLEQRQLRLAADQRCGGETRRVVHAQRAPGPQRLGPALDLERAGALDLDRAGRQPPRSLADENLPRLRRLLQPHGQVHGLAGRERRFGVLDDDLSRLDADPDREPERLDLRHDLERGSEGPLRVVLVRQRHAERRHHRVSGELLDRAAVVHDRPGDLLEVPVHALPDDLGIGARDERGRADEVDEDHRRDLAFHRAILPAAVGPAGAGLRPVRAGA